MNYLDCIEVALTVCGIILMYLVFTSDMKS